ncbi:MAG: glycosyl hydrolase, partial [Gemmatimonadaceae bacterium]
SGPAVPPGRYSVRLTADGKTATTALRVVRNPWITDVTDADLRAQYVFGRMVRDKATEANRAVIAIRRVKAQLDDRLKKSNDAALASTGATLRTNTSAVEENVYQVRNQSGQDPLNFPIKVNNRLANLLSMSEQGDGRPTTNMPEIFGILSRELAGYTKRLDEIWKSDLVAVNRELTRLNLARLDPACIKIDAACTVVQ